MLMFRYSDVMFADGLRLVLEEFEVHRRTPKGVWLELPAGGQRFVRDASQRRFAHETPERAFWSYLGRKAAQRRHIVRALERVERALELRPPAHDPTTP